MRNLLYLAAAALVVFSMSIPSTAQDADKKREDMFGKSFEDKVEEAVDEGCDWLKKQQGCTAPARRTAT